MSVNILADPPTDILACKQRYARMSRIWLAIALCTVAGGIFWACYTEFEENFGVNLSLGLFFMDGCVFVYYTEKYMEYRSLKPEQRHRLRELIEKNEEIAAYHAKVTAANREITVMEFEAAEHHDGLSSREAGA